LSWPAPNSAGVGAIAQLLVPAPHLRFPDVCYWHRSQDRDERTPVRGRRYQSADCQPDVCDHGDMSLFEIVTGVLVALAGIAGLIFMPPVWAGHLSRRETRFRERVRSRSELSCTRWPLREAIRRGVIRGYVPATLAGWGIIVAYWVKALSSQTPGHIPPTNQPIAWFAFAWVVLWLMVLLTVIFFNRPKFIVPPSQRDEAGALAEWRSSPSRRARVGP
jgi:hypothetical protein